MTDWLIDLCNVCSIVIVSRCGCFFFSFSSSVFCCWMFLSGPTVDITSSSSSLPPSSSFHCHYKCSFRLFYLFGSFQRFKFNIHSFVHSFIQSSSGQKQITTTTATQNIRLICVLFLFVYKLKKCCNSVHKSEALSSMSSFDVIFIHGSMKITEFLKRFSIQNV